MHRDPDQEGSLGRGPVVTAGVTVNPVVSAHRDCIRVAQALDCCRASGLGPSLTCRRRALTQRLAGCLRATPQAASVSVAGLAGELLLPESGLGLLQKAVAPRAQRPLRACIRVAQALLHPSLLSGCLPGRLSDLRRRTQAVGMSLSVAGPGRPGGRRLWRHECRGPCGRASDDPTLRVRALRPCQWVVVEGCGAANVEASVGVTVHPPASRSGLWLFKLPQAVIWILADVRCRTS